MTETTAGLAGGKDRPLSRKLQAEDVTARQNPLSVRSFCARDTLCSHIQSEVGTSPELARAHADLFLSTLEPPSGAGVVLGGPGAAPNWRVYLTWAFPESRPILEPPPSGRSVGGEISGVTFEPLTARPAPLQTALCAGLGEAHQHPASSSGTWVGLGPESLGGGQMGPRSQALLWCCPVTVLPWGGGGACVSCSAHTS